MIVVHPVPAPTPEVRSLVEALEAELSANYPPEQRHGLSLDAIFQPHIRFFVARSGAEPVGCGGIALLEGFAELKRMYVRPAARGTGVVQALLARLEAEARAAGRLLVRLETGTDQHAALRAYQRAGYERCPAFPPYAAMPARATATSTFMQKALPPLA